MKNELNPTLWRTARALANADRLNLMRLGKKGLFVPEQTRFLRNETRQDKGTRKGNDNSGMPQNASSSV